MLTTDDASVTAITTGTSTLESDLLEVGGIGLGIGVAIYVVKKGWSFFRSLV